MEKLKTISNHISKSDPILKYLLFSHVLTYLGVSVPLSAILFGVYFIKDEKIEEIKENKKTKMSIYDYLCIKINNFVQ